MGFGQRRVLIKAFVQLQLQLLLLSQVVQFSWEVQRLLAECLVLLWQAPAGMHTCRWFGSVVVAGTILLCRR